MGEIQLCDTEIGNLRAAVLRDQDVAGLHVAMDDALGMRVIESIRDFCGELKSGRERKLFLAGEQLVERFACDVFKNDVGILILRILAHIENGDDTGVMQSACGLRFVHEAKAKFLFCVGFLPPQRNGLHRDQAFDLRVASLVDDAHGSPTQFADDLVSAEALYFELVHGPQMTAYERKSAGGGIPIW